MGCCEMCGTSQTGDHSAAQMREEVTRERANAERLRREQETRESRPSPAELLQRVRPRRKAATLPTVCEHGDEFTQYKCMFCCRLAPFACPLVKGAPGEKDLHSTL